MDQTQVCKSCGNTFSGSFCNVCGEKVLRAQDQSFKNFLHAFIKAITLADSPLLKSMWLVVSKPGFLTKEFTEGRRLKYLKPLSLFLILNLAYFFFPVIQLFNASLKTQLLTPFGHWYGTIISHKIVSMGIDLASFTLIYNLKTVGFAKLMVMVFVVIASLPLNFLYAKSKRYFTDHIDYTVELACFNLLINAILLTIVAPLGIGRLLNEYTLTGIFICTNLYFLIRSGREYYADKKAGVVIKSVVMILFLKLALEIYRAILFFVTIGSL